MQVTTMTLNSASIHDSSPNQIISRMKPDITGMRFSAEISDAEISHFDELVRAGRIIAILAWADRMAGACADFRPMSENIDFLCKTLNLRGLGELAEKLRGNPGPGV
jgi:hypothetical protein